MVITYKSPRCTQFQITHHIRELFKELFTTNIVSYCHGREETKTVSFSKVLATIVSEVQFSHIAVIISISDATGKSLLALRKRLNEILRSVTVVLVLIVEEHSGYIVHRIERTIIINHCLNIESTVTTRFIRGLQYSTLFRTNSIQRVVRQIVSIIVYYLKLIVTGRTIGVSTTPVFEREQSFCRKAFGNEIKFLLKFQVGHNCTFKL